MVYPIQEKQETLSKKMWFSAYNFGGLKYRKRFKTSRLMVLKLLNYGAGVAIIFGCPSLRLRKAQFLWYFEKIDVLNDRIVFHEPNIRFFPAKFSFEFFSPIDLLSLSLIMTMFLVK